MNSQAVGTTSLVSHLDPARRLSGGVSESDVLALTQVTVIDATGRPALPEQTVLVKGDRIAAIEKSWKSPKMRLLIRLNAMSALWQQCQQGSSNEGWAEYI